MRQFSMGINPSLLSLLHRALNKCCRHEIHSQILNDDLNFTVFMITGRQFYADLKLS